MIPKPLQDITKEDILKLETRAVPESLTLDYKLELYNFALAEEKHEFLEDVTALANTAGGDLVIGVSEEKGKGVPASIPGVPLSNLDNLKTQIQSILRDSVDPRLPLVDVEAVEGFEKGSVLILRVPKSFAAPHMVKAKGGNRRFCGRNSSGKYQMDSHQIRSAFQIAQNLQDRIQAFRYQRIANVIANESPVSLSEPQRLVLHLMPLDAFNLGPVRDLAVYWSHQNINDLLQGIRSRSALTTRLNFDGYLITQSSYPGWYLQFFRNGVIEFATHEFAYEENNQLIYLKEHEPYLIEQLVSYLKLLTEAEVPMPYAMGLALVNIKGCHVPTPFARHFGHTTSITQDHLIMEPQLILAEHESKAGKILKPMLDMVWQAMGIQGTPTLDDEGNPKT